MLNIDNALSLACAAGVQADTSTPQPQDGTFSLALEAECEKMLVSADSQTAALTAVEIDEDLKNVPLPDTSAPTVAREKKEAGKSGEGSSLSATSFLGCIQPLWQNLPGSAGEQLPGKANTSAPSLPAAASEVAKAVTGSVVAEAMLPLPVPPRVGDAGLAPAATRDSPIHKQATPPDYVAAVVIQPVADVSLPADLTGEETLEPTANAATRALPLGAPDSVRLEATVSMVAGRVVAEAMLPSAVPSRAGDRVHVFTATTGSPVPEQATPPDHVVAIGNQPVAAASLPVDFTGGETLEATANAATKVLPLGAPDSVRLEATVSIVAGRVVAEAMLPSPVPSRASDRVHVFTATTGSPVPEQATPPDHVVAIGNQPVANASLPVDFTGGETLEATANASTKVLPLSAPDSLRLETTVSMVRVADNPKPAGSDQPEAILQKQADPAGPNPSDPLASAQTHASNGDAKGQQSQGSKQNNPEINISRRSANPEEEQRAVRAVHEPVPETQLPSDPRGPVSSHDTGQILPAGLSKTTETPNVPQSQVWNQIEESSVISQLVSKARGFHWEKNSEIVISLKPESLGRISLRASIIDQTVVATIVTESNKVKNLIELEMPVLHHALQENGMPVKVAVVQGSDLSFSSTAGNGQSHLNQNPSFQKSNDSPNLWAPQLGDRNDVGLTESPEVVDSRYRSRSIHLIA